MRQQGVGGPSSSGSRGVLLSLHRPGPRPLSLSRGGASARRRRPSPSGTEAGREGGDAPSSAASALFCSEAAANPAKLCRRRFRPLRAAIFSMRREGEFEIKVDDFFIQLVYSGENIVCWLYGGGMKKGADCFEKCFVSFYKKSVAVLL